MHRSGWTGRRSAPSANRREPIPARRQLVSGDDHLPARPGSGCGRSRGSAAHPSKDSDVVTIAKSEGRVLITFDLDFGEIYFRAGEPLGVIIFRVPNQTIEAVNHTLGAFFAPVAGGIDPDHSLVVIEPNRVRISS